MKKNNGINILIAILLMLFAAFLCYQIYNVVVEDIPADETPVVETYTLKFEGGPIEELDISDVYEEGMTWSELAGKSIAEYQHKKEYYVSTTYAVVVSYDSDPNNMNNTFVYYLIQLDGENLNRDDVVDLSVTYTLNPNH